MLLLHTIGSRVADDTMEGAMERTSENAERATERTDDMRGDSAAVAVAVGVAVGTIASRTSRIVGKWLTTDPHSITTSMDLSLF